jgi:hypothetical protein
MNTRYVRLYSDDRGESHFEDVEIDLKPTAFAPPAPPSHLSAPYPASRCFFLGAEAKWTGEWHPSPATQFMIILSGQFEVEASDGEKRTFRVGDVLLLADTNGKGHFTRDSGRGKATVFVVQLA